MDMLTFFRRIRKGLLSEGATSKYLLYAVGEIALVVIGILIALQINNWNEDRKQELERTTIISELLAEFERNYKVLQDNVLVNKNLLSEMDSMLSTLDSMKFPQDQRRLMVNYRMSNFKPSEGKINSMSSTNTFYLIKNQKLRSMLMNWSAYLIDLRENELEFIEDRRDLDKFLAPYITIRPEFPHFTGLIITNKLELSNRLHQNRFLRNIVIYEQENLVEIIEEIVRYLQEE